MPVIDDGKIDGSVDPARKTLFSGEAQMLTSMGALPISFDIEADTRAAAVAGYGPAANVGFERAVRELQEMRRQSASSLAARVVSASALCAGDACAAPSAFGAAAFGVVGAVLAWV